MSSFMSFLTLGLTADAAAAHRHEFSSNNDPTTSTYSSQVVVSRTPSRTMSRTPSGSVPLQPVATMSNSSSSLELSSRGTPERESTPKPKTLKTKTTYHLASPPPSTHINRIHSVVRPGRALILQLQRLHASKRPVPTFDVIPSLAFATKPKRKRPISLRTLGLNDLVILSSEAYTEQHDDDENEDEDLSSRTFIASISPVTRRDKEDDSVKAFIEFPGGNVWEASQRANGSYEFVCRQDNGQTLVARWFFPKNSNSRRRSSQTGREAKSTAQGEKKFQFSMINANTRRHPILATLSGQRIDINDQYHVSTNVCSRPSSPSGFSRFDAMSTHSQSDTDTERVLMLTEDHIKTLIVVTGTWVALREGFNGRSWFDDSLTASPAKSTATAKSPTTPTEISLKGDKRGLDWPVQKVIRRSTLLGHQATTPIKPLEEESEANSTRRANSTGSTFKRCITPKIPKFESPHDSPVLSRAPTPEPPAQTTSIPGGSNSIAPPVQRATVLTTTPSSQIQQNNRFSTSNVPTADQPIAKPAKLKTEKERWRRRSTPARSGGGTDRAEGEKRTLRQKISRVFGILRRNSGG